MAKMQSPNIEKTLGKKKLNNVVRFIKKAPLNRVLQIRNLTFKTLRRLRVARDKSLAIRGIPLGGDDVNTGWFIIWCNNLAKDDTAAIEELKIIDATCCARWE